jgi:DNA-binding NtrC family response regulator
MGKQKRILICDDETGIREALNLILSNDYELDFASSGDEAIGKTRSGRFDGILLDIKMPDKDGLETLKEIKQILPGTKIIIVTGYQSVETALEAIRLGAADYITKPFSEDEVKAKVSKI